MTGVFDGSLRVATNHRNQWSGILEGKGYRSYSFSLDKKIKAGDKNYIGIGLLGLTDVAGELSFGSTQGKLSFSYMRSIGQSKDDSHYIIIGQNFGATERRIDLTEARWPSRYDVIGMLYPTLPFPAFPTRGFKHDFIHLDMTTGLMWISLFKSHNSLYGGLAVHHVNKPNVSFLNRQELLSRRLTIHAGGEFGFNDKLSILPSIAYNKQGVNRLLNIGSGLRRYFSSGQNYADFGINYLLASRIESGLGASAMAFFVRSRLKGFSFGISHELVLNELSVPNTRAGIFELSLGYIFGKDTEVAARMPRY